MSSDMITLEFDATRITDCTCVLLVPDKAVEEPGYIKGLHSSGSANKHEFHALAQTAYYQYQDDELDITAISGPVIIRNGGADEQLTSGLVIYRDSGGAIKVAGHETVGFRALLESANRFCTRWVRLDI